jgi:hypothetical protein
MRTVTLQPDELGISLGFSVMGRGSPPKLAKFSQNTGTTDSTGELLPNFYPEK